MKRMYYRDHMLKMRRYEKSKQSLGSTEVIAGANQINDNF